MMTMRYLLAFLGAVMLGATGSAAPQRDWTSVATPAPAGGYVIGNPAAKVKLVEYVSYTCPHCREFTEESAAVLKGQMVRSGSTSIEIRSLVRDRLDITAATLARCVGAAAFPKYHALVYARQDDWFERGSEFDERNGARMGLYPPEARMRALADGSGLSDIARAAGMTDAGLDRCFADRSMIDATVRAAGALRQDVDSTPAFEINGKLVQHIGWAQLQPMLRAAGAK